MASGIHLVLGLGTRMLDPCGYLALGTPKESFLKARNRKPRCWKLSHAVVCVYIYRYICLCESVCVRVSLSLYIYMYICMSI